MGDTEPVLPAPSLSKCSVGELSRREGGVSPSPIWEIPSRLIGMEGGMGVPPNYLLPPLPCQGRGGHRACPELVPILGTCRRRVRVMIMIETLSGAGGFLLD